MNFIIVCMGAILLMSAGFAFDILFVARGWQKLAVFFIQCMMIWAGIVLIQHTAGIAP